MKNVFYAESLSNSEIEKTLNGFLFNSNITIFTKQLSDIKNKNIEVILIGNQQEIFEHFKFFDDDILFCRLGFKFNLSSLKLENEIKQADIVTFGFSYNHIIYNKFSDNINNNIFAVSKEFIGDMNFNKSANKHIPEILCQFKQQ